MLYLHIRMEEKEELQEKSNPPQDQIVAVIGRLTFPKKSIKSKAEIHFRQKKSVAEVQNLRRGGSLAA